MVTGNDEVDNDIGNDIGNDTNTEFGDEIDSSMNDEINDLLEASTGTTRRVRPPLGLWGRALWAVALIPALALVLLLSMALRVRLTDGAWPSYNNPDPKDLGLHYTVAILAFLGAFLAAVAAPILALVSFLRGHRSVTIAPLVVAGVGFLIYLLVLRLDLGGLGEWFAD